MARTRYDDSANIPLRTLPAAALRAVLREGYSLTALRRDVLAGAVVGLVAVPLSMALAVGVGVAPQHGLYTAIVAGFLVAVLGGSRTQVTGPTAAFIVVLAPLYERFGLSGLLMSGLVGGGILVAMGLLRLGSLIRFIPYPVTTGFTAGIATVIATLQLKDLLGLRPASNPAHYFERVASMFHARETITWQECASGLGTLALLVLTPRLTRRVPGPLIALPVAAVLTFALSRWVPGFQVDTIGSRFHAVVDGVSFDGIPALAPTLAFPWSANAESSWTFDYDSVRALLSGAFAIAMLGAIESLLSAVVADGMAGTRHDPDAELIGLGIGNIVAPFFGGIAATGAIARTATNVRAGGRSPFAAVTHAFVVLAAVVALAPLLGHVPMSALAALLLIVAWNMADLGHVLHILRVAPRSDVLVLVVCYGLTVAFDMVVGVTVGMVLASLLFMRRMADVTQVRITTGSHPAVPQEIPPGVVVYEISGPLFFGAAQKAISALRVLGSKQKAVVLCMDQVTVMDATGLVALERALDDLRSSKCQAVLCGVQDQPRQLLARTGVLSRSDLILQPDLGAALRAVSASLRGENPASEATPSPTSTATRTVP